MFACQRLYGRITKGLPYLRLAIPFAMAGIAAFAWPELMCGGDAIFERILDPVGLGFASVSALLLAKYVFTTASFGSGAPGGTLFPLVIMGALIGSAFMFYAQWRFGIDSSFYENFIALGIAGLFASVVRAPVTGVVLVFELTGSLDALLSVSLVSIIAYMVANMTKTDPFYEHLLSSQLGLSADNPKITGLPGEKAIRTFHVSAGSRIEGKRISEIPWPDGARVILIERASSELIPEGSTKICALDDLMVILSTDAEDDVAMKLDVMTRAQR